MGLEIGLEMIKDEPKTNELFPKKWRKRKKLGYIPVGAISVCEQGGPIKQLISLFVLLLSSDMMVVVQ